MTSIRRYHRFIIAAALFGAASAIAGLTLLILNIPMPGTICLIAGAVIGLIAGMEWRCRERPISVYIVKPPTAIVIIPSNAPTQQPLDVK
jgi:hypothetical protein